MNYHLPAILFLLPLFAAIAMPVVCLKHREWSRPISLTVLSAMVVVSVLNLNGVIQYGEVRYAFSGWAPPLGIEWVADGLASVVLVALSVLGLLALVFAGPTAPRDLGGRVVHFYVLILLLIAALTGIAFAGDLFNLFVFLEVAAIASYGLVGVAGGKALFAAFRYLLLGTLGASLYLLGVSYFYAASGTLNMADMAEQLPHLLTSKAVVGGLLFMFIGLGIKMALVPFHVWLPDAYTHAPESISPILAALVTKVALLGWIRIIYWVLGAKVIIYDIPVLLLVGVLGTLAAVIGAVLALMARNIKTMFAYGGISHIGIILIGVTQGNKTGFAGRRLLFVERCACRGRCISARRPGFPEWGPHGADRGKSATSPLAHRSPIVIALGRSVFLPAGGFFGRGNIIFGALEATIYGRYAACLLSTLLTRRFLNCSSHVSPKATPGRTS